MERPYAQRSARDRPRHAPPIPVAPALTPSPLPSRQGDVITLNAVRQKTGERLAESLAYDPTRIPGDRGRFHRGRSRAEGS